MEEPGIQKPLNDLQTKLKELSRPRPYEKKLPSTRLAQSSRQLKDFQELGAATFRLKERDPSQSEQDRIKSLLAELKEKRALARRVIRRAMQKHEKDELAHEQALKQLEEMEAELVKLRENINVYGEMVSNDVYDAKAAEREAKKKDLDHQILTASNDLRAFEAERQAVDALKREKDLWSFVEESMRSKSGSTTTSK